MALASTEILPPDDSHMPTPIVWAVDSIPMQNTYNTAVAMERRLKEACASMAGRREPDF